MYRYVRREGDFVNGSNTLFRIDKEPFPVHRYDFDGDWLLVMDKRFAWLQCVSGFPGQNGQEQDDQNRYRPDHSFHFVGV